MIFPSFGGLLWRDAVFELTFRLVQNILSRPRLARQTLRTIERLRPGGTQTQVLAAARTLIVRALPVRSARSRSARSTAQALPLDNHLSSDIV
jgi:hypothetical protein